MAQKLKILQVEDLATEAELALRELKRAGISCECRRVETEVDFRRELAEFRPDVILSDFSMPYFDGMHALAIAAEEYSDIPFIFVSGTLGEEYAVRALKNGATDYVLKTNLIRLPAAVERAIEGALSRRAREEAEGELRRSETALGRAQQMAKLSHIVTGPDGVFVTWSETLPHLLGVHSSQVPKSTREWLDILHPNDREFFRAKSIEAAVTGARVDVAYRLRHASGEWIHVQQSIEPILDAQDAAPAGQWFSTLQDVTEQKESERRIKRLNRVYAVLSGINSAIVRIRDRQELFNEACRIVVEDGEFPVAWIGVVDRDSMKIIPVASAGAEDGFFAPIEQRLSLSREAPSQGIAVMAVNSKKPVVVNDVDNDSRVSTMRKHHDERKVRSIAMLPLTIADDVVGVLALHAEVAGFFDEEELRLLSELAGDIAFAMEYLQKEERLNYLAYYDALTGLPNSTLFQDRLTQFLHAAKGGTDGVATLLINIDRFRELNDSLGRQAGDTLLKMVGERLGAAIREPFTLARTGADNFALAIAGIKQGQDVADILENHIAVQFHNPFSLKGDQIRISAKAGIALHPGDGAVAETLFANAEAALKQAKSSGESYLFYAPEMNAHVAEKLSLENKLRQALEREEFVLHYQPKVNLSDGRICGLEALIRWNNPETGLVPPLKFIPLLEETGFILQVGAWALGQAESDYRKLCGKGIACPRIAVNVSPLQLRQKDFAGVVAAAIGGTASQSHGLDIEITESVIMENIESNIAQLRVVREMGVNIAIDDFGTGYSSLAYIAKLPVNTLKIDRSFVLAMENSAEDLNIVSTIISLAHSLNLKVVAEGVETEDQRDRLRRMQCDEMQGYLFSPPVSIEKIEAMLLRKPA